MPNLFSEESLQAMPDDIRAIFEKLDRLITDEATQNDGLPPIVRELLSGGLDCDELPNGAGEFGRAISNPIPVNGPIGELLYLSSLRTRTGSQVMFHRLGSSSLCDDETGEDFHIDTFSVLALDLSAQEDLHFHMYHPRKSTKAPAGYTISASLDFGNILTGTNSFVAEFPAGLDDHIRQTQMDMFGVPLPLHGVRAFLNTGLFTRKAS